MFTRNSQKVLDILKELTLRTDTETCTKGLKRVRKETKEPQTHYDGTPEGAQNKQVARADLKKIFYKNETTLKF